MVFSILSFLHIWYIYLIFWRTSKLISIESTSVCTHNNTEHMVPVFHIHTIIYLSLLFILILAILIGQDKNLKVVFIYVFMYNYMLTLDWRNSFYVWTCYTKHISRNTCLPFICHFIAQLIPWDFFFKVWV